MSKLNRFEWLKAIMQRRDLTTASKVVASALSVQFANGQTGQINPSLDTLVEYLGLSLATIKRAIKQLAQSGWLDRTEGRGAGNHTRYSLKTPCKIMPFRARKKRSQASFYDHEKGSTENAKGFVSELSYKAEQSKEQKAALEASRLDGEPSASARGAPRTSGAFVSKRSFACRQWEAFSKEALGDWMERAFPEVLRDGEAGYLVPTKYPPTQKAHWGELCTNLIDGGWLTATQNGGGLCYAS